MELLLTGSWGKMVYVLNRDLLRKFHACYLHIVFVPHHHAYLNSREAVSVICDKHAGGLIDSKRDFRQKP